MYKFDKNHFYTIIDFIIFLYDVNFSDEIIIFILNNLNDVFYVNLIFDDENFKYFINRFCFYDIIKISERYNFYGIKLIDRNFIKGVCYGNRKRKKVCS